MCFPSIEPMQLEKFQRSSYSLATTFHSSSVEGISNLKFNFQDLTNDNTRDAIEVVEPEESIGESGDYVFDEFQPVNDDDITEPEQGKQPSWRSTKQPLPKERKHKAKPQKSKENITLDEAVSALAAREKPSSGC